MPAIESKTITTTDRNEARKQMFMIGNKDVAHDIFYMIKSRFRILYICTPEEVRVMNYFRYLAKAEAYDLYQWDLARGLRDGHSQEKVLNDGDEADTCPEAILRHIIDRATGDFDKIIKKKKTKGSIFVLLDYHRFLEGDDGTEGHPLIQRLLKQFSQIVSAAIIVVVSPTMVCPPTIEKELSIVDFPFPSKEEIKHSLARIRKNIPHEYPKAIRQTAKNEEELIRAVSGLTLVEAENAFARSLVKKKFWDVSVILKEKKQVIRKSGILEYRDPRFTMDDIGGLDSLKDWILQRRLAFTDEARDFGLPMPKGLLLLGTPGTGKSMVCDAIASAYKMPLLRLDFGAIFASHVGQSEGNMRRCLAIAGAVAPCVLWLDEVEKGVSGTKSSEFSDGGTTSRVFGSLLTWMQEKQEMVFVACTANDVLGIPPELMRAGRLDEVFFLDLPDSDQRHDVTEKLLFKKHRNPEEFGIEEIVDASDFYSPAEIEKGIDNALFTAFSDGKRDLRTEDIVSALKLFSPLYNTRKEEMQELRSWALGKNGIGGRARLANSPPKTKAKKTPSEPGRILDLDT